MLSLRTSRASDHLGNNHVVRVHDQQPALHHGEVVGCKRGNLARRLAGDRSDRNGRRNAPTDERAETGRAVLVAETFMQISPRPFLLRRVRDSRSPDPDTKECSDGCQTPVAAAAGTPASSNAAASAIRMRFLMASSNILFFEVPFEGRRRNARRGRKVPLRFVHGFHICGPRRLILMRRASGNPSRGSAQLKKTGAACGGAGDFAVR